MNYEEFEKHMAEKFPRYCGDNAHFGGYAIGEGWYHVIETLIAEIDSYTKWKRNMRVYDLRIARAKAKGREAVLNLITKGKTIPSDYDQERVDTIMENEQKITDYIPYIVIDQIKEKFGGLRFYYHGGDAHVHGMTRMAEIWAGSICEKCGDRGTRRSGGWMRTLCDTHEAEYQEQYKNMKDEDA
jgi:hypothetical protein